MKLRFIDVNDDILSIKYNKQDDVYNWGDDNAFPQLVKGLICTSTTAKQCVDINSKYIYGKGFAFTNGITDKASLIVNKKQININQLLRMVSKEFSAQNNVFLQVNYNAAYEITSVEMLGCDEVRIGKSDSSGYSGKFIVYDNWDKSKNKKIDKKDFKIIDKYNPNPKVIDAQVDAAGGWSKWNGQILQITGDFDSIYSLSDINTVVYDANSQFASKKYKNSGLKKGMFGSMVMVTKPFDSPSERNEFTATIKSMKGSDAIDGILHLEAKDTSTVLAEEFLVQTIADNVDAEKFKYVDESTKSDIIDAFGVPSILVNQSDNSIFGNSGELLNQAKLMHWENKEEERQIITDAFETLFSKFATPINPSNDWTITPILKTESTNE